VAPDPVDSAVDSASDSGAPMDSGPDSGNVTPPDPPVRMWTLRASDGVWIVQDMPTGPHAPAADPESAFALAEVGQLYVLTRSSWHALDLTSLGWISSGERNALFPEVASVTVASAWTAPASWNGSGAARVYLQHDSVVERYAYDLTTRSFRGEGATTLTWSGTAAPLPGAVRFGWLDTSNANGWATGDPAATCGAAQSSVQAHQLVGTRTDAHVLDLIACDAFVSGGPLSAFAPFTREGSPDPSTLLAMDWTGDRLIAFGP